MIKLEDKSNVNAPSVAFPYGSLRNNPGDNTGTPVNVVLVEDVIQFMEKLMAESGIVANGLPDNEANGWQLFEALKIVARRYKELTFIGQHDLSVPSSSVVSTFDNDLGTFSYTQGGLGIHQVTIASLIGKSLSDLDISIESQGVISGTAASITPRDITFDTLTGSISFVMSTDGGSAVNGKFRFHIRVK